MWLQGKKMKLSHLQAILVTLKLGQGMLNLTFRLVPCIRGEKMKPPSQGVYKPFWFPCPGDLEIRSSSLYVELDLQISGMHMRFYVKALWSYSAYKPFWFPWLGDLEIRSRSLNVELDLQVSVMYIMVKKIRFQVKALWNGAYKSFWFPWLGDLEIKSRSLNVELDLQIRVTHEVKKWRA